jgi:hypothetical protein
LLNTHIVNRNRTSVQIIEGDRLGQREAEPADAFQIAFHLRLTGDRLDLLTEDEADADAGADRTEARTDAERDCFAGAFDTFVGDFRERQGSEIHRELLPF